MGLDHNDSLQKYPSHHFLMSPFILLISLLPLAVLCGFILRYFVDVPYWDDWRLVIDADAFYQGKLTFAQLWHQQNEHRLFFAYLFLIPAIGLTSWNTLLLLWLNLACATAAFAIIAHEIFLLARRKGLPGLLWFIPILSLMAFSLRQWQNWYWVIQLTYFLCFLLGVWALAVLCRDSFSWKSLWFAAGLAAASTLSEAMGFSFWLAAFGIITMRKDLGNTLRFRAAKMWAILFTCMIALYSIGYVKPPKHPPLSYAFKHPHEAIIYYLNSLGGALDDGFYAKGIGLAGIFLYMTLFSFWWKRSPAKKNGLFFAGLAVSSLFNAALITFGRCGFHPLQALESRYALFTYPFWISTGIFAMLVTQEIGMKNKALRSIPKALAISFGIAIAGLTFRVSVHSLGPLKNFYKSKSQGQNALLEGDAEKALLFLCPHKSPFQKGVLILKKRGFSLYRSYPH